MSSTMPTASLRPKAAAAAGLDFLAGGGEMGALIRSIDWGATPLGTIERWSVSLRMMVSFLLVNRFPLLLWWGPEYIQLYNDPYRPVLGAKHPKSMGQPAKECWSEIWSVIGPLIDTPFQGGPATWIEDLELEIHRHGFLEECHFTVAYSPVPDESVAGGISGVLATVHEITEKVIGERRLQILSELGSVAAEAKSAEEACLNALAKLAGHGKDVPFALIYLFTPDGNPQLAGTAGMQPGDGTSPSPESLTAGESPWPLADVLRGEETIVLDDLAERLSKVPAGPWSDPPRSAVLIPVRSNTAHQLAGVLIAGVSSRVRLDAQYRSFFEFTAAQIATSVANARAYEEERRRAEALAEIDRAKTAFFSNVSHEFRTPLTLMLGPVGEAVANPLTPAPVRAQLELAHRNSLRLLKLVNSLLDFSRIEAGRVQATYAPTDLAVLTRDLSSTFRSAIERAGLLFDVDCTALDEPVCVDRDLWEKIVLNLLSNAFKFTFAGTISVTLRRESTHAVLEVSDTGVGIPEHELPRLFERFHRVEGTAGRTQEGSGIGLALVRELVRLHCGNIEALSQVGQGTTFRVRIPFGASHLPAERIKGPRTQASTATSAQAFIQEALHWLPESTDETAAGLRLPTEGASTALDKRFASTFGARIVLADDNSDMRAYVRELLAPYYSVEAVADGEAALEAVRTERPQLILTDVMMPRLDGLGLLQAVRADEKLSDIPIVLLSARAGEESRIEGLDAGADDYLVKPFSARELLARIGALLELTQSRREHKEQLQLALSSIQDQFYVLDREWRYTLINPRVSEVTGLTETQLLGHSIFDVFPDLRGTRFEAEVRTATETRQPRRFEFEYSPWQRCFEYLLYPAGEGIAALVMDVTERKRIEDRLAALAQEREQLLAAERAARTEAESANRLKDEFLATVSHELRTPLSNVVSWGRLLQKKYRGEDEQFRRGLSVIVDNALVQAQMISDLLDMSRIVSGKIQLESAPTDLGQLLESVATGQRPAAEARGIELSCESLGEPLVVEADSTRLQQVLWNLISNAIKFTPEGGRVSVAQRRAGDWAELSVRDTGAGIPAQFLPHVFERFRQVDGGISRRFGGLGLGLAIVKQLVELHGGTVQAESPGEGCGATFTVRLPLQADYVNRYRQPINPRESEPEVPEGQPLEGWRILAVEDDAAMRELLERTFMEYGAHITAVPSAAAALDALRGGERFNLLLSDLGLSEMDGFELLRTVRTQFSSEDLPAIAVTAFSREEDRALAIAAGFQAYITKPYEVAKLVGLTRKLGAPMSSASDAQC